MAGPHAGGAAMEEKAMDILHERVAGLDVHKNTVVACVRLKAGGETQRECRTFATTTEGLLALGVWLKESRVTHVAMEATGVYWMPVWKILCDGDFELIVANAAHIKNVPGRKTDINDAMWIADLLACGLIKASFVPPEELQELRSLTLLTAIYHMLKYGIPHHDLGSDHFDRRPPELKAKRLVAQLAKLGFAVQLQPAAQVA